jgi:mono/diheme cytochrome c family protein
MRIRLILALFATTAGSVAASAADADHGRTLARRWCATCHVVAANQQRPTGEAPPFAVIAKRPDFDATKLANFLLDPHPKMPNMSLTRPEAADLVAYIATLHADPPLSRMVRPPICMTAAMLDFDQSIREVCSLFSLR